MSDTEIDTSDTETTKARKLKKAKAAVKANGAAKPAKAAKGTKSAAKAASKPAKGKAKAKPRGQVDQFGFQVGSLKSKAAAMYSSGDGATLGEVKKKLNSVQLNLLTSLKSQGYKVTKSKEDGPGKRPVTRYHLRAK